MIRTLLPLALLFTSAHPGLSQDQTDLFVDGSRVTLLGGTSIERMQSFGYFETLITTTYPDRNIQFRNIGWSGDDVFGTARAVFGRQADGFKRLEKDLLLSDPNVILVCYGANESHGGESGQAGFLAGLSKLFDTLEKTKAKIVLISPSRLEDLGAPLPDPTSQNQRLKSYSDAIRQFAATRNVTFIDFYQPIADATAEKTGATALRDQVTDNGMHLNPYGHWRVAPLLATKLGVRRDPWNVKLDLNRKTNDSTGVELSNIDYDTVSFSGLDHCLPYCAPPEFSPRGSKMLAPHDRLQISGLAEGKWGLQIDGKPAVVATDSEWAEGVYLNRALYLEQPERLRATTLKKNELFFHRHRPQNETYLFLFRKHEQGNNAAEIPQFDKLIADQEAEIAKLKLPQQLRYKLEKVK